MCLYLSLRAKFSKCSLSKSTPISFTHNNKIVITLNLCNFSGLNGQWTPITIRMNNREFNIPLDAPVHSPITRVFIVDGAKRAEDINVTLTRAQFAGGLAFLQAHDFFELFPLRNSRGNIQFELQLKKPLIDKFKAHDQVSKAYLIFDFPAPI